MGVAAVQANRRLVQDVESPHQARTQRGSELNALRLSSGQGRCQSVQGEIFQPHVIQKAQPLPDFHQQFVGDTSFLRREFKDPEKFRGLLYGHGADLADVFPVDLHLLGFNAQPRPAAGRTHRVTTIPAQEDTHMELVFLALQVIEESAHARELAFAIDDRFLLLGIEIVPGHIQRNLGRFGEAFEFREQRTVLWLRPWLHGSFVQGLCFVRNHQVQIKVDGVAKSLATGTSAIRIVKRKQTRFWLFIANAVPLALEALAVAESLLRFSLLRCSLKDHLARFAIRDLNGVDNPGAPIGRHDQPIDQHKYRGTEIDVEQ